MYIYSIICMYVCISVCMDMYMYVCMYACVYWYVCMYACMHACTGMYVCMHLLVCMHVPVCMYVICTGMYVCKQTHTHTHTHTYISRIRRNLSIHIARFSASESPRAYINTPKNLHFSLVAGTSPVGMRPRARQRMRQHPTWSFCLCSRSDQMCR